MALKPKAYEFINNNPSHNKSYGFIAQELKEFFPEIVDSVPTKANPAVSGTFDNQMGIAYDNQMGIAYSQIGVIAIKAIQEQQEMILELRKEIDLLKKKLKN